MSKAPYTLLEKIASGTYSYIYRVRDQKSGQLRAMKSIRKEFAGTQVFHSVFRWNTDICTRISHPNIITSHDFVHDADNYFLIMDLVEGYNLLELSTLLPELPISVLFFIFLETGRCLQACHEEHIIHRNLSSTNVMVARNGDVRLGNFGLAAIEKPHPGNTHLADRNIAYLAPEQIMHLNVTAKADIWTYGVMVHELILKSHPFASANPKVTETRICEKEITISPEVDPGIAVLIKKCLYKDPAERYPSISIALEQMENMLQSVGITEADCRDELVHQLSELRSGFSRDGVMPEPEGEFSGSPEPDEWGEILDETIKSPEKKDNAAVKEQVHPDKQFQPESQEPVFKDYDEIPPETSGTEETEETEEFIPESVAGKEEEEIVPDQHVEEETEIEEEFEPAVYEKDTHDDAVRASILESYSPGAYDAISGVARIRGTATPRKTDRLLLVIMVVLAVAFTALVITGDYFNVSKWPVDWLNRTTGGPGSSPAGGVIPQVATRTPSPLDTGDSTVSAPVMTGIPRMTSTPVTPEPTLPPTAEPVLMETATPPPEPARTLREAAVREYLKGDLDSALERFREYVVRGPDDQRTISNYIDRIQSLARSVQHAKDELNNGRYKSALTQLSIVEEAYLTLAKTLDPSFDPEYPTVLNGLNLQVERNKISEYCLFLFLPEQGGIAKMYVNGNPVQVKPFGKGYTAYARVPRSMNILFMVSYDNGQLKRSTVKTGNLFLERKTEGFWIINNHSDIIRYTVQDVSQTLKTDQYVFVPSSAGSVSLLCGRWGTFTLPQSMFKPGTEWVERFRIVYLE